MKEYTYHRKNDTETNDYSYRKRFISDANTQPYVLEDYVVQFCDNCKIPLTTDRKEIYRRMKAIGYLTVAEYNELMEALPKEDD